MDDTSLAEFPAGAVVCPDCGSPSLAMFFEVEDIRPVRFDEGKTVATYMMETTDPEGPGVLRCRACLSEWAEPEEVIYQ